MEGRGLGGVGVVGQEIGRAVSDVGEHAVNEVGIAGVFEEGVVG